MRRAALRRVHVSYVLPLRSSVPAPEELDRYLRWLSNRVELIVVDGSSEPVFEAHTGRWATLPVTHLHVDSDLLHYINGKVAGVLTGVRRASHDALIIADDDVRYDAAGLEAMMVALEQADVVRPQNYFDPMPWHGCIDTGRTLLNRMSGGDWPGTIAVRRTKLVAAGGYDGDVLFENLELVRTIVAAGGVEYCPLGLYVRRLPPSPGHFWSQRVRQAYDEFARPARLLAWLAIVPGAIAVSIAGFYSALGVAAIAIVIVAEAGRRREHGTCVFPVTAALAAPLWVAERAVCAWLAVAAFVAWGGVRYRGRIVARAATPLRVLQQRVKGA
jgi:hypothetical protein